jgi:Uma2 family endonuclease
MSTAPTLPLVSVEEYLNTSYYPDMEYVDGVLVERSVPAPAHSTLAMIVADYLFRLRKQFGFAVLPDCRTQIVKGARYRIPDVLLCGRPIPAGRVVDTVPWVVIEVLSPEDKMNQQLERFRDYAGIGVRHIVLLDPELRIAWRFEDESLIKTRFTDLALPNGMTVPFDSDALFEQFIEEQQIQS